MLPQFNVLISIRDHLVMSLTLYHQDETAIAATSTTLGVLITLLLYTRAVGTKKGSSTSEITGATHSLLLYYNLQLPFHDC